MKHNTCVMRGRSLHRRLLARQPLPALLPAGGVVSTASGVAVLPSLEEARHSRQNSRDSNRSSSSLLHPMGSRNASNEAEAGTRNPEPGSVGKNIEIYATLPKKKGRKAAEMLNLLEESGGGWMSEAPTERQSRSSSASNGGFATVRRERAKSEERKSKPVAIPSARIDADEAFRLSAGDASSDNSVSKSPGKKQHRIRRRLLMGGLIKRKNRSLPDLRADEEAAAAAASATSQHETEALYSEEYANSNFNLERSKLMRRQTSNASSVTSASPSRGLVKVPPPPPLRKTSHLSATKLDAQLEFHPADAFGADIYDHGLANYRKTLELD